MRTAITPLDTAINAVRPLDSGWLHLRAVIARAIARRTDADCPTVGSNQADAAAGAVTLHLSLTFCSGVGAPTVGVCAGYPAAGRCVLARGGRCKKTTVRSAPMAPANADALVAGWTAAPVAPVPPHTRNPTATPDFIPARPVDQWVGVYPAGHGGRHAASLAGAGWSAVTNSGQISHQSLGRR